MTVLGMCQEFMASPSATCPPSLRASDRRPGRTATGLLTLMPFLQNENKLLFTICTFDKERFREKMWNFLGFHGLLERLA